MVRDDVEVLTGKALGRDFTLQGLKDDGYRSVVVATGAQLAKKVRLEGSEAEGVIYGIPFLREVNNGGRPEIGKQVIVIGGGNVAMDVARSAIRIVDGGKVSLYYRRTKDEMPAYPWEIEEGEEEGLEINASWSPTKVVSEGGKVTGIEFVKTASTKAGDRTSSLTADDSQKVLIPADTVILAIGQDCDLSFVEEDVKVEDGVIQADSLTLETNVEGVFAGGDTVLGPASLVEAVEHGHRAAESVHRYLRGLDMREGREPPERPVEFAGIPKLTSCEGKARHVMPLADASKRTSSFDQIDLGLDEKSAVEEAQRCLNCGVCSVCRECVRVCKAHAIDHEMKDQRVEVDVGAIIFTGGYEPFDARRKSEYGFGRYPNVVTSMQFERVLSASGPYEGHLQRPSDGKTPRKVAWIQCVGSRDVTLGNDYCSSVCCMYATKQAIIAKEHEDEVEPTIFFIDVRAFGKGFEGFYNRSKENYGVRYVRSQVSSLKDNPENDNIIIRYVAEGNGGVVEEEFDMVVLSIGLTASPSTKKVADICQIETNRYGFAQAQPLEPLLSGRDGIYLSGAVSGPKDIPETVMQSSAAAALCGELLSSVRGTEVQVKEYPTEIDVMGQEPRIGVFVCHCGSNIASVVDVDEVSETIKNAPGVVYAENTIYTCSQDTQERIKEIIKEQNLNRVVVASCTPRTHEPLFQETMREAGLNQYLFEMADIREQCSWVHQQEPALATAKAKALVRGSVGKSRLLEPLQFSKVGVTKASLVIGGGISGMTAALSLARQGFDVSLVERSDELGGNLRHVKHSLEGHDWQKYLQKTIGEVQANDKVKLYLNSEIDEVVGFVGNFKTKLKGDSQDEIKHGTVIVATGADEFQPDDFLFGQNDKVITQRQLEKVLENGFDAKTVVMVQCVGSRDDEHPYCSRICCGEAVKNALAIKQKDPEAKVYILYRDIRTYEYKEEYYRKARDLGVMFVHFPDDNYPKVTNGAAKLAVTVHDTVIGEDLTLNPDLVVLSAATVPDRAMNTRLGELLKAPLTEDGFFMEAHVKLRPVDFANEGIFVCGLAHSPKYTEENVTQALAAAGRAACILAKDQLEVGGLVSVVDPEQCASCLTCVRECVYDAPFINAEGKAEIEGAKCQGCGNCAAACPGRAIQLRTFTDAQEQALFRSILKPEEELVEVG